MALDLGETLGILLGGVKLALNRIVGLVKEINRGFSVWEKALKMRDELRGDKNGERIAG